MNQTATPKTISSYSSIDGTTSTTIAANIAMAVQSDGTVWRQVSSSSAGSTPASVFTGATSTTAGTSGLVPAPAAGDEAKYLKGDGTWAAATATSQAPNTLYSPTSGVSYIEVEIVGGGTNAAGVGGSGYCRVTEFF